MLFPLLIVITLLSSSINNGCDKGPDSSTPPDTLPVARFSYTADLLVVTFTNESENYENATWDFADGSDITHVKNPVHDFITGSFNVILIVSDFYQNFDTIIQVVTVARFPNDDPDPNFTIESPYKDYPNWYRGQIHTHTNSLPHDDGENTAGEMVQAYKDKGYDFIAITGHDTSVTDPGVEGILFIRGEELSGVLDGKDVHSNAFNLKNTVPPGIEISEALKLDSVLVQINHPNRNSILLQDIVNLEGLFAIEIANYYNKRPGDMLLWNSQISLGKKIWCNAGDDMHDANDAGHNATIVNSPDLSVTSIMQNLKNGNFYIAEGGIDGPDMSLSVDGKTITCSTTRGAKISWYKYDLILVSMSTEKTSSYTAIGNEVFVRVEVENASGKIAYSQPFFLINN